jgi:hypothetical protein
LGQTRVNLAACYYKHASNCDCGKKKLTHTLFNEVNWYHERRDEEKGKALSFFCQFRATKEEVE